MIKSNLTRFIFIGIMVLLFATAFAFVPVHNNGINCPTDTPKPPTPTDTEIPPADTPIPTDTPTLTNIPPTDTQVPPTSTNMPPTNTLIVVPTEVTSTSTAIPIYTQIPPTNTPTPDVDPMPTSDPTPINTEIPTSTSTDIPPTSTVVPPTVQPTDTPPTSTVVPPTDVPAYTDTPYPPKADAAGNPVNYPGKSLGTLVIGSDTFQLYQGVNAKNGSLMLPSHAKGAALYQGVVWVHRMWGTGWISIKIGDTVLIQDRVYRVVSTSYLDYGKYPTGGRYIATCYSDAGGWLGTQLYRLELIIHER